MLAVIATPGLARAQGSVLIKMGTAAPEGSSWHQILREMGGKWREGSNGAISLRIYAGGVLGDEPDMVRKMRVGQIHAAALTAVGLAHIDQSVSALQIPMMFDSYAELDHVRESIRPALEKKLGEKGFVVLNWGDAGWVMFFAKQPFSSPADLKKMKLFVWAGDSSSVDLWKAAGFNPIPLASTDILPGLQTGLINAFDTTPLLALSSQWFGLAPHMLDLRWAPLVGATVITKRAWRSIPREARNAVRAAAEEAGRRLRDEIRAANEEALVAMKEHGLTVHPTTPEQRAAWRRSAEEVYPRIRGNLIPAEMFDEVRRIRDEYRGSREKPPAEAPDTGQAGNSGRTPAR
jgi:TRAP-type C4-dicarboxylate transport system substrate-binding protein